MKFLVVLSAICVLAHATPLATFGKLRTMSMLNPVSGFQISSGIKKETAHDMAKNMQLNAMDRAITGMEETFENADVDPMTMSGKNMAMAQNIAADLTNKAQQDENIQMQEFMNQIQMDDQMMMMMKGMAMNPEMIKQKAMREMQMNMWTQQADSITSTKELKPTLEAALEAQMVLTQNDMISPSAMEMTKLLAMNFQTQVQQLIEENNMEKTQMTIVKNQYKLKQLQNQVLFLYSQIQQLRAKQLMIPTQGITKIAYAEQKLAMQLKKLMSEEMALQLVIQQLQQVLMSQQKETIYTQETMTFPMMMMKSPMMMKLE